jgi:23S rRNA (cytidine1920-2'-O)/16S rRNA (cytidine1409-2'-O)-methyltransferase
VIRAAGGLGWQALGLVASPITGPAGNHEYLLWLKPGPLSQDCPWVDAAAGAELVAELVARTLQPAGSR